MKTLWGKLLGLGLGLFVSLHAGAMTYYVNVSNMAPVAPYTNWPAAATNIQNAIDISSAGDLILVADGVYANASGASSSRINVSKAVLLQSVNGPTVTTIQGSSSLRCVNLVSGATLSGFTLTGGQATVSGGGISCGTSSTVSNCIITGNFATQSGGGVSGGGCSYYDCIISGNTTSFSGGGGGGGYLGTYNNCLIMGNSTVGSGGGVNYPTAMTNCTVVGNSAASFGGGVYGSIAVSKLRNCIVYYNSANTYSNIYSPLTISNCCTPDFFNSSCITNPPGLVDVTHGNYHLQLGSPCINAGDNGSAPPEPDLDGNPRIFGGTIDIGAYENSLVVANPIHYVNVNNRNPVLPYTNWPTAATNIQDAIDSATNGDYIVVGDGVYKSGGRVVYGSQTNRVVINKAVTVQSVNGPATTFIQGNRVFGNNAVRCVYLTNNAALVGFTLTNGETRSSGDIFLEESGAGLWCESTNAFVTNCVLITGIATAHGGGSFSGTLVNSALQGNQAGSYGGGAYVSTLVNCTVSNNNSVYGGGAYSNILINSTLVKNFAAKSGGGTFSSSLTNCVLSSNSATNGFGGGALYGTLVGCTLTNNNANGGGGACSNTLNNCSLIWNGATNGGGAYYGSLVACTLAGNGAQNIGGGSFAANLTNCILIQNGASYAGGGSAFGFSVGCSYNDNTTAHYGGGVFSNTTVNCFFLNSNMSLTTQGGGCYGSTLNNCWITSCVNGGAYNSILENCCITYTISGDAANGSILNNCTIRYNSFSVSDSGARNCYATNCIIYNNIHNWGYVANGGMAYCCTTPLPTGPGNFTNAPVFLDSIHQQSNSPCIDTGYNSGVVSSVDIDGRPRIVNGTVDVGASEYQGANMEPFIIWLSQYSLPDDGSADYADSDGDGMNNWQEWIAGTNPTNAASVLKLNSPTNSLTGMNVTWQSVSGVTYYLQRSTNLAAQPPFTALVSNLTGQAVSTSYTDTSATNATPYFYRVGVQ